MTIRGTDELELQLSKLANPEISKRVVMAGAQPVADEIRKGLEKNLQGSEYSKGDLLDSLGIAPADINHEGNANTKIGFDGYDSKGVPNEVKARAMESGTSKQDKKPFVRPGTNRSKDKAIEAMQNQLNTEIESVMK
ncbi:MAG TPA: HK97-gp10 family putative phage morphogenesis protein [Mobilitalea sp.]|nr:HK97-gp10 family putative phage morphogenesis protein [Mobilitalea sp.]